jgi:spermidine/putrescine transport system ATP-binding protein
MTLSYGTISSMLIPGMLQVDRIIKYYEGSLLLREVSFQIEAGETIGLLGSSGSGKSTLLRIIAGLETADAGRVLWQGQDLAQIPTHRRGFGLMFQDYALFPHRNVEENVAFGLRMQRLPKKEIENRVKQALERVNLSSFATRRVTDLSGGEQQRVALARALAPGPRLLMLDEPLGALDRSLREELSQELRRILHTTHIPAIYVTHDQQEAFSIADRLLLLHDGRIVQDGTPSEIYQRPASPWVASFFGLGNLVEATLIEADPLRLQTRFGIYLASTSGASLAAVASPNLMALIRPSGARLILDGAVPSNLVEGVVMDAIFRGEDYQVTLQTKDGQNLFFYLPQAPAAGQFIRLSIDRESVVCVSP